jgi:hypothetical protein
LLSRGIWQPFVSAGLGVGKDDLSAVGDPTFGLNIGMPNIMPSRDESGTSLLGSLGAGLRYAVNQAPFYKQMPVIYCPTQTLTHLFSISH